MCHEGRTSGSKYGKTKHKTQRRVTQANDVADDRNVAAAKAAAPAKSKGKAQKGALQPKKGKSAGRVGLINPTPEEIKKAFQMLNPHNRSVISAQDIARVSGLLQLSQVQACVNGAVRRNSLQPSPLMCFPLGRGIVSKLLLVPGGMHV